MPQTAHEKITGSLTVLPTTGATFDPVDRSCSENHQAPTAGRVLVYSCRVQFEVEIYKNDVGEWVATAIAHDVSATGRTENEALAILMEKLSAHFKKA